MSSEKIKKNKKFRLYIYIYIYIINLNHRMTKKKKKKKGAGRVHTPTGYNIGYTTTFYLRIVPTTMGPMPILILFIINISVCFVPTTTFYLRIIPTTMGPMPILILFIIKIPKCFSFLFFHSSKKHFGIFLNSQLRKKTITINHEN